jgi:hypothetical protein
MKMNKNILWALVITVVVASLLRVIPNRLYGFTPQLALAIFSGAFIKDKKLAFLLPIVSMFISDLIYQALYLAGVTPIYGFYKGQWINYALIASVTVFGLMLKNIRVTNVLLVSIAGPTFFFLISNFLTWAGVGDYVEYTKDLSGLMLCYEAGLPFYKNSLIGTVVYSGVLFGSWYMINRRAAKPVTV